MSSKSYLLALLAVVASSTGFAQQSNDKMEDIIKTGRLRAALPVVAPHFAIKDATTGILRGVSLDVAKALAEKIGVTLSVVEYPGVPEVLAGLKADAWDIAFLSVDPARGPLVEFSHPFQEIDVTYLVAGNSSVASIADADQSSVRIVVARSSIEDNVLKRVIKKANVQIVSTAEDAFEAVKNGTADAFAITRSTGLGMSARLPGSKVLDGRIDAVRTAIAVPKGKVGRVEFIDGFLDGLKSTAFVAASIQRNAARGVSAIVDKN